MLFLVLFSMFVKATTVSALESMTNLLYSVLRCAYVKDSDTFRLSPPYQQTNMYNTKQQLEKLEADEFCKIWWK